QIDSVSRLRAAVNSVEAPPFLEAKIRHRLLTEKAGRRWLVTLIPAGAAMAVITGMMIAYQLGHLRLTVRSQESYIASVSTQIATLMRVGLGDHIHCSVFPKYPEKLPAAEEFIQKMRPEYAGLIPIVRAEVPETYRLSLAHLCRYPGRQF